MDLKAVYKKTQKGLEEMAHRTVLGMRERTLLVMVDGKATAADLLAKAQHMPDPPGLLAKLIDGGFIAADTSATAAAATSAQVAAAPQEQRALQELMRYAEHFLDEVLGPEADMLSEAIDKCKTVPELRDKLEKTREVLVGMGKKRKAEEFWANVEARLEGRAPPAPAAAPQRSIQEAVRFARRYLNDVLGPGADALVEPIEKCKTLAELQATMEKTRDALAASGSKRTAEEFWKGAELRLPVA
jgi:hypothetical protein